MKLHAGPDRRFAGRIAGVAIVLLVAAQLVAMPSAQGATLSVNCGTGGNLQAKINAATSGSTILVKGTCFGSFQVVNQSLTIKGNPTATLDGNDIGRALLIANPSANVVHLVGLTV